MANITKRKKANKDGTYSYSIRVFLSQNADGKQDVRSMTFRPLPAWSENKIQKELNKAAVTFEEKCKKEAFLQAHKMTVAEFLPQYFEAKKSDFSPTTYEGYKNLINTYLLPTVGHMKLTDVTPYHMQKIINQMQNTPIKGKTNGNLLKGSSVVRYFNAIKSVFTMAYKQRLIPSNPTRTELLNFPKVQKTEIQTFSKEEVIQLVTLSDKEPLKYRALLILDLVSGFRRGELVALRWKDVDLINGFVSVNFSAYKITGEPQKIKEPKTDGSKRTIAIPQSCVDILKKWKAQQAEMRLKMGSLWIEGDWVFTRENGTMMSIYSPWKWLNTFLKRNSIPHKKWHALRHTSATLLVAEGVDVKTVGNRLGHSQLSTTNIYVHALQDPDKQAAEKLDNIFTANNNPA